MTVGTETEPRITYRDMRSNAAAIHDEHLKENVLRGIELLNEKHGPNWVDHIDPRSLILSSSDHCVLGQLYENEAPDGWSGYSHGRQLLNLDDPSVYGFDREANETYTELTNAWRVALGYPELDDEPEEPSLPVR